MGDKQFAQILKGLNYGNFDFDRRRYVKPLIKEFKSERPHGHCCRWCVLDCIYSVKDSDLIPFFSELITAPRDWYELETAIFWLLDNWAEESRELLTRELPAYLTHEDSEIRDVAIKGIRKLNTNEALALLWEAGNTCTLAEEEGKEFKLLIDRALRGSPEKYRNHHIIL